MRNLGGKCINFFFAEPEEIVMALEMEKRASIHFFRTLLWGRQEDEVLMYFVCNVPKATARFSSDQFVYDNDSANQPVSQYSKYEGMLQPDTASLALAF